MSEIESVLRDRKLHARVFYAGRRWYAIFSATDSAREYAGQGGGILEAMIDAVEHVRLREEVRHGSDR